MEALDLRDVHLVGHSLGGWTAMETAIRSTERIRSLTLIAPVGIRIQGKPVTNIFFMNRDQLMNALYADKKIAQDLLAIEMTPEQIDEVVNNSVAAARLAWHPRFFNPHLAKWLHRIKVPTHIVWGANDEIVPPAYAGALQNLIAGSKVTMLDNTGHIPYVESLDAATAAITDFFGRNG